MRISLLLFLSFILTDLSAQVTYDPAVAKQFDSVYNKLSPEFQKAAEELKKGNGYSGGILLCTDFIDDTLNIKELKSVDSNVRFYIDGKLIYAKGKMLDDSSERMPQPMLMLILNVVRSDTLDLEVTPWFMSEQTIRHKISGNSVTSSYEEYYKEEHILRAYDGAPVTNDLTVPVTTVKFILSDSSFTEGKTIYGMADVITKDFLFEAAPDFIYHILKHRFHFKYYFKITVKKEKG